MSTRRPTEAEWRAHGAAVCEIITRDSNRGRPAVRRECSVGGKAARALLAWARAHGDYDAGLLALGDGGYHEATASQSAPKMQADRPSASTPDGLEVTGEVSGAATEDAITDSCADMGVNMDRWQVDRWKWWDVACKGNDGELRTKRLFSAQMAPRLRPAEAPPACTLLFRRAPSVQPRPGRLATILAWPDTHVGHRRQWDPRRGYWLEPMHDRAACDALLQYVEAEQPDELVYLGDFLDHAEGGRHPRESNLLGVTEAAVNEAHWLLVQMRQVYGGVVRWIGGNHEPETRAARQLKQIGNQEVASIAPAGETTPLLHTSRLLHFDTLGIETVGDYGSEWWPWQGESALPLCLTHGHVIKPASARIKDRTHHFAQGHDHRLSVARRTISHAGRSHVIHDASAGYMGRLGDAGPPKATTNHTDWQQGALLITLDRETGAVTMEPLPIHDGALIAGGRVYQGRDTTEQVAAALRMPSLAA